MVVYNFTDLIQMIKFIVMYFVLNAY